MVLRSKSHDEHLVQLCKKLCKGNSYTTTIHAASSWWKQPSNPTIEEVPLEDFSRLMHVNYMVCPPAVGSYAACSHSRTGASWLGGPATGRATSFHPAKMFCEAACRRVVLLRRALCTSHAPQCRT